jgi:hypothetical protein
VTATRAFILAHSVVVPKVDRSDRERHNSYVRVVTRLRGRSRERRIAQLEHELAEEDARISWLHAAETAEELRVAAALPRRSRRLPRAAIPAAAGAVVVAAALAISLATGHFSSGSRAAAPAPVPAAGSGITDWALSDNNGVSILLPPGWANIEEDERGWSYGVMRDNRVQARIEVTHNVRTDDPAVLANRARRIARRRPGYHESRFRRETMNGEDAVRFDYLTRDAGTNLRVESVFFIDSYGRGIGFVEQVPAVSYGAWKDAFQRMRNSLSILPESIDLPPQPVSPSG